MCSTYKTTTTKNRYKKNQKEGEVEQKKNVLYSRRRFRVKRTEWSSLISQLTWKTSKGQIHLRFTGNSSMSKKRATFSHRKDNRSRKIVDIRG